MSQCEDSILGSLLQQIVKNLEEGNKNNKALYHKLFLMIKKEDVEQDSVKMFKYFREYNVEKYYAFIFSKYLSVDSDALWAYKYTIL